MSIERIQEAKVFPSLVGKLFYKFFSRLVRKRLGKQLDPNLVMSNHSRILWGFSQLMWALSEGGLLEPKLKSLVSIRTASLIGCPF